MAGRDRRHAWRGALARWLPVVLVVAVLAGAVAAYRLDLGQRWSDPPPDPATHPAQVPPPEGISIPELAEPSPVATPEQPGDLAPERVRKALAPGLRDKDLGPSVHAMVADLDGSAPVFSSGTGSFMPASTTKLLTTTAALETLGPDHRFATTVVAHGRRLTLVGGGDPLLASSPQPAGDWPARADVVTLARRTAQALTPRQRKKPVRLAYDASLFPGSDESPHWRADYVPDDIVSPITALWVDEGRDPSGYGRSDDPARAAADAFAAALRRQGIELSGQPQPGRAPGNASEVARVEGAPLSQVVEHVLLVSDNEGAEVLGHHVGLAVLHDGTFAGGARATRRTLAGLGVPMAGVSLYDGSGLSRDDRLRPRTLVEVLRLAADPDHPELRAVLTGLPVAAFTGSLSSRFDEAPEAGIGRVRAKTGTLTGVSALAGIGTDRAGTPLVFVLAADKVRLPHTLDARQALDNLAGALGACRCTAARVAGAA